MSKIYALIVAGGIGTRSGLNTPKQFFKVKGKPIVAYTLEKFNSNSNIDEIIIVSHKNFIDEIHDIINKYVFTKVSKVVSGGSTRQKSVFNGLSSKIFSPQDILLIHDAARPYVSKESIDNCIQNCRKYGATGLYIEVKDTITEIQSKYVSKIPNRNKLFITQTPQAFSYEIIYKSHKKYINETPNLNATDDVSLVLYSGYPIYKTGGDYSNIKITSPEDLRLAQYLL